jgi:hypothetical protein
VPIPEQDKYLLEIAYVYDALQYGKACYAAGKADALPPWPPEDGKVWRHSGEAYKFVGEKWNFIGKWGVGIIINSSGQIRITAAYFRGELELVS